jgi:hypothetical protein
VCTTSADLEQLADVAALRDCLVQHAGAVYQHANAIRRVADDESLYVVSGCIKNDSWALAAYQEPTEPSGEILELARRNMSSHEATRAPTYDWLSWMGEARFGSNSEKVGESYKGKDQSIFLRGFKLAFSRECRARLNVWRAVWAFIICAHTLYPANFFGRFLMKSTYFALRRLQVLNANILCRPANFRWAAQTLITSANFQSQYQRKHFDTTFVGSPSTYFL